MRWWGGVCKGVDDVEGVVEERVNDGAGADGVDLWKDTAGNAVDTRQVKEGRPKGGKL